jgi:siderophore synthetase component
MHLAQKTFDTTGLKGQTDPDAQYICMRVVDTLLRENVRECVTRGTIVDADALPPEMASSFEAGQRYLQIDHMGSCRLWIPVTRQKFMQSWRLTRLPVFWQGPSGWRSLHAVGEILACFRNGLPDSEAQGYIAFEAECVAALSHRRACETERECWFEQRRDVHEDACGADLPEWGQRLLHYDRLAAFHDHPFYPTARAKLGFDASDLRLYAPEFQPVFQLNWLAVPRSLYCQSGGSLPPGWPDFAQVGLPSDMAKKYVLVPVHPFVWNKHLDGFLHESGLLNQVVRAPDAALRVTPTLSVRTLALCDSPAWHVKLPLTIRTLGGRNIRTIKPSTIVDGHLIQTLLARIVEREPGLQGHVELTAEDTGAHVAQHTFLGFIVRHYPEPQLDHATLVPVAALTASAPSGRLVVDDIVERFFDSDREAFLNQYLALTLRLHLTLWLRYGIALESNQQNSVLVFNPQVSRLGLLLKDNDAARIHRDRLQHRWPDLAEVVADLQDKRIGVGDELPLAQMFTTITLQLNIAALIEAVAQCWERDTAGFYATVRQHISAILAQLEQEGENVEYARHILMEEDYLYIKYLLVAATLVDKQTTGATDVNKYYGRTAPNFLRRAG